MSFYFYMYGNHLGSLWIHLEDPEGSQIVFQVYGEQGKQWIYQEIDLTLTSDKSVVSIHEYMRNLRENGKLDRHPMN